MADVLPYQCPVVEAIVQTFPMFREMASMLGDDEVTIGDFIGNKDFMEWNATCKRCVGEITVRNFFTDKELGTHAAADLPDNCPSKPIREDQPVLFYEETPGPII